MHKKKQVTKHKYQKATFATKNVFFSTLKYYLRRSYIC